MLQCIHGNQIVVRIGKSIESQGRDLLENVKEADGDQNDRQGDEDGEKDDPGLNRRQTDQILSLVT